MLPAGPTPTTEPTIQPSATPSPGYLWNQVSDAVHSGPDAMSHLLLNTGDSFAHLVVKAVLPGVPRQALAALAAATSDADLVDTQPLAFAPGALDALEDLGDMLEDAQVPVLSQTLLAGLINAGDDHVVLRVTARVADTSLEQALAVLRRRLYLDLNSAGFTASFTVPGSEAI